MRTLIGIALLGLLFLTAAFWQELETADARDRRRHEFGVDTDPTARGPQGEGWTTLVLGSPSRALSRRTTPEPATYPPYVLGDEPMDGPVVGPYGEDEPPPFEEPGPAPPPSDVVLHTVQPGEILGRICDDHYGTSKPRVVNAVASYNGLPSPNALGAGAVVALPPLTVLLGE